ncbi:hypothetical protein ACPJHQ_03015 [Rossellomorea sp. H39__3]
MRVILNILAFALVIVMNTLAVTLPLNNQSTGEISDRLDIMLTPAGYVFSIWSLIYLLLGIWVLRQIPKARRDLPSIHAQADGSSSTVSSTHYGS